ncbi:hypothetical protein [Myxococcus qinghaiensis]|uniref:hypothetical protein n=1 Tax=Myxococcus qinghaiensis TaxID=2906758 RepID=UPI0020A833C6|nr:hypothetical protein [Myxococcus qinghaiensis]MCP3167053.1 hypothetical protein [Myxococcus qinghaiensis]
MAHFFSGHSMCRICERIFKSTNDLRMFPAFIPRGHSLWTYSDGCFHLTCFDSWEWRATFLQLHGEAQQLDASIPKGLTLEENEAWHLRQTLEWHQRILREDPLRSESSR